jgi:hypothetical protein
MNLMVAILMIMTFVAFVGRELLIPKRGRLYPGAKKS